MTQRLSRRLRAISESALARPNLGSGSLCCRWFAQVFGHTYWTTVACLATVVADARSWFPFSLYALLIQP